MITTKNEQSQFILGKTIMSSRHGKGANKKWDIKIVFKILQLLSVDAKSTVIQSYMQLFNYLYARKDTNEIPFINFIHQCRIYVIIINALIAAMRLRSQCLAMYHNETSQQQ